MFKILIIKCMIHQRLALVEITINSNGMNVVAQRAEQFFLQRADFAARIEDHHANIFHAVESMRHGRAGITGGRSQNGNRLIARYLSQDLGHKRPPKSLKASVGPWNSSRQAMSS